MGKVCAFLGNDYDTVCGRKYPHSTPPNLKEKIKKQIINLIENENVTEFWVGEIGGYEQDAYDTVLKVKQTYPDIRIIFVISKVTDLHEINMSDKSGFIPQRRAFDDYIFPPACELGYKRMCIVYRNRYITENADFIIAYNERQGKAYEFCKRALAKGCILIELSSNE